MVTLLHSEYDKSTWAAAAKRAIATSSVATSYYSAAAVRICNLPVGLWVWYMYMGWLCKTDEPIEMSFERDSCGRQEPSIRRGPYSLGKGDIL